MPLVSRRYTDESNVVRKIADDDRVVEVGYHGR